MTAPVAGSTGGTGDGMTDILDRFRDAQNARDIEAFVALFHPAYRSEQPAHPGRAFVGRDQVRANWTAIFTGVPGMTSELVRRAGPVRGADGTDAYWGEWHWYGDRLDGTRLEMRGTTIMGERNGLIEWGVLYMSEVHNPTETITQSVREMTGRQ